MPAGSNIAFLPAVSKPQRGLFMQQDIAKAIFEKVKTHSADQQKAVPEIDEGKLSTASRHDSRPIWDVQVEMRSEIPDEIWDRLPPDGSVNVYDHHYGAPRKN